ncbi:MAG: hypothetical protein LBT25_12300 [Candidatus Symbiothrix sp.]|jgi:hypothetical protein|nr:hypothetical protein [Candidatus Symbiothrix sp.]
MYKIMNFITATVLFSLLLLSCDSWLGVNITQKSQLMKLQTKIKGHFKQGTLINEIRFVSADQRSLSVMGSILISYTHPGENGQKRIILDLSTWETMKNEEIANSVKSGISIDDYDFSKIATICKQAISKIDSLNMKYAGIEQFVIRFSADRKQPLYEFTMDGRPKGSPVTTKGRYAGIYYHEINFVFEPPGDMKITINDKLKVKRGGLRL